MIKEPFRVVCCWDHAIDHEHSDTATYHDTRDFALLRFVPESRPFVFFLRDVDTRAVNRYVLPATTDAEQRERAFRAAVVRVDGLEHEDGRIEDRWEPKRVERTRKDVRITETYELISDDELALFDAATVQEIGGVAHTRFFCPRAIVPIYQLPPTSLRILAIELCRRAALAPSTPEAGPRE